MRGPWLVEDARWYPALASVTISFLFCVYMVTFEVAAAFDADSGAACFVGLSLPWGALVAGFSMRDHRPFTARQFAWAALGASIVLVSAAIVRFTWIRPALGQALAAMDLPAVADAVAAMDWLERTLALQGPLLSIAAWWLLRWMEPAASRPPRRPGSLVQKP